jgi:pyruvate/2-oxoglutarate dehydrogenase complex dihydrolipoamide dehydrogenase (E3) component
LTSAPASDLEHSGSEAGFPRMEWDLVVVGGGAAGLSAARAGARSGKRTVLVSEGPLGGDCTFTGCVPSKTLIESTAQRLTFTQAMTRVRDVVERIAATEDASVLRGEGITVREGRAHFVGPRKLSVEGEQLTGARVVIATGSSPMVPSVPGLDTVPYLTNETVFDLTDPPESLVIVGGGPIGCELAQAFNRLGVTVTVVEAADRLLPREDVEVGTVLADVFSRDGIALRLGVGVTRAAVGSEAGIELHLDDGSVVSAARVLVAAGRRPETGGLGLDAGGVAVDDRGFIQTDDHLATSASGVLAVGDVTGRLPFTHAADEMGRIAVANAFGRLHRRPFRASAIPWVTFTEPEVARIGMTEVQAAAVGGRVAYLPMTEVDRAITAGRTDGFVKLLAGPRRIGGNAGGGKVLGATIVSERAGELIHEVALAMRTGMFTGRLAQTVHAYPTWSVAVRQAAGQFFLTTGGRDARPAQG